MNTKMGLMIMVTAIVLLAAGFVGLWELVLADLIMLDRANKRQEDSNAFEWDCIIVTLIAGTLAAIVPTILHARTLKENITLKGILPVCMRCKKIRDAEDNWIPMEVYIRERSKAEFSHGLCPECKSILYPDS
jgi:hypothetical protein